MLSSIGSAITTPIDWIGWLAGRIGALTGLGTVVVWIVLAAIFLTLASLFGASAGHRALAVNARASDANGRVPDAQLTAAELERASAEAEADGRFGDAVRERFQAGLLRLAELGTISSGDRVPNAVIARALRSAVFERLAQRFEQIVYGGAGADADDAEAARADWSTLLAGVAKR